MISNIMSQTESKEKVIILQWREKHEEAFLFPLFQLTLCLLRVAAVTVVVMDGQKQYICNI